MKRKKLIFAVTSLAFAATAFQASARDIDFKKHVKPVLEAACVGCHNADKDKGDLRLDTKATFLKGGESGPAVIPGKPDESLLYKLASMSADEDDVMPPKAVDHLSKRQLDVLKEWIEQGAKWPDGVTLTQVEPARFVKDVQPIFEFNCVACHRDDAKQEGGFSMTTFETTMKSGDNGPNLVPFDPEGSYLYKSMTLGVDEDDVMPPKAKDRVSQKEIDTIRRWVEQGAKWPEGLKLSPKKKTVDESADGLALVRAIHARITKNQKEKGQADMKPYTHRVPDSLVDFHMVPIPGGQFVMGSPESETKRADDEGPQHKVKIDPFWMGKHEVTWNEFELFMYQDDKKTMGSVTDPKIVAELKQVVASSEPTKPYVEMSFGMGKDGYPAISMTQHSARKFCQWLSARTGQFYRLPTEAEWEYACRAGTTTAYHFGDDPAMLGDYAWYEANSDWKYQKVGKKKPNPWGLYDMHGNVAEWVVDQYSKDYYKQFKDGVANNPLNIPVDLYPRPARGGSWDHNPEFLRSSARLPSHPDWKIQDPQLPKSIWFHTDAQFLGMRLVRPLKIPSAEEMHEHWSAGRGNGE
ncbi:MAG: formylglycine-generating enzyme required for sulfatase activity/mono [Candidatus Binatia bacterium]|jgi:formylglycine-generating enzyme required for sulfatase activity/mono/diheme cytochrome c family protein